MKEHGDAVLPNVVSDVGALAVAPRHPNDSRVANAGENEEHGQFSLGSILHRLIEMQPSRFGLDVVGYGGNQQRPIEPDRVALAFESPRHCLHQR
jgi:hypothetical protein